MLITTALSNAERPREVAASSAFAAHSVMLITTAFSNAERTQAVPAAVVDQ